MPRYLLNLLQLLLSPTNGWEDISRDPRSAEPERLQRHGLMPLIIISALTEFTRLFYVGGMRWFVVLERAVLDFGCYFIAARAARLVLEMYAPKLVDATDPAEADPALASRIATTAIYGTGLMVVAQIVVNCFPPGIMILKFIPLYVLLVVYESSKYIGIGSHADMRYIALVALAVVAVPLVLYSLLMLLI